MTSTEQILSALANHNCDPKLNGSGWSARCPAHEDRRPSLSVSEGDDGRALVCCHAGCTVESICDAVGLRLADLMPDDSSTSTQSRPTREKTKYRRQDRDKPTGKTYQTAKAAIEALERKHRKRSALWTYHDAQGEPLGVIVRWDRPDGTKDIRPIAHHADGWRIGGMSVPRPLYGLVELESANLVFVCEGEKAADAVRSIGLVATTSPHGSSSADKADWSPLAGKQCVILPDNDGAGRAYADDVAAILSRLTPAPSVRVVELKMPDNSPTPKGGDAADWVGAGGTKEELSALIEATPESRPSNNPEISSVCAEPAVESYRPFPVETLPPVLSDFVAAGAKSIICDPALIALPLLCGLAGSVGATRWLRITDTWTEPSVLWGVVVSTSGSQKSPAQELALAPLEKAQSYHIEREAELYKQYLRDMKLFDIDFRNWNSKGRTQGEPQPEEPESPRTIRYVVDNTTIESLAARLQDNPRGLLVSSDELSAWLGSMGRYASGATQGEKAQWLSMYRAGRVLHDRGRKEKTTTYVRHAAVSIIGGIPPKTFRKLIAGADMDSGMAARLLIAMPPKQAKRWSDQCVSDELKKRVARIYARLLAIDFVDNRPVYLKLTPEAKELGIKFVNQHGEEQVTMEDDLQAAWSKLEAVAFRLALLFSLVCWAESDRPTTEIGDVQLQDMQAAIELVSWFSREWRRFIGSFSETTEQSEQRRLADWILSKGGQVTARDVQQGQRRIRTSSQAEQALNELVAAGYGVWTNAPAGERGGRPTRLFHHSTQSTYTEPSNPGEVASSVDVDSVDNIELKIDDEWGEL